MKQRLKRRDWLVIVGIAVLLHVAVFFLVKPSYFSVFRKSIRGTPGVSGDVVPIPTAFYTIPIELETESERAMEPRPPDGEKKQPTAGRESAESEGKHTSLDLEDLLGETPHVLPYEPGPEASVVPPKPREITWPDARRLSHCLGHHIDLRIQVDEAGEILNIEVIDSSHPPDCVRAAVESAKKIVFSAGRINGIAATMWTQVRIDFRAKR